jgi:hypothetical protein
MVRSVRPVLVSAIRLLVISVSVFVVDESDTVAAGWSTRYLPVA